MIVFSSFSAKIALLVENRLQFVAFSFNLLKAKKNCSRHFFMSPASFPIFYFDASLLLKILSILYLLENVCVFLIVVKGTKITDLWYIDTSDFSKRFLWYVLEDFVKFSDNFFLLCGKFCDDFFLPFYSF